MSNVKRQIFEDTLTSVYKHERYVLFLKELLNDITLAAPNKKIKPWNTFSAAVDSYRHIGNYMGSDNKRVVLLSVCLKNDSSVENARSMQRSFVKTLLDDGNCSGALVAFHTGEDTEKWRLSFVRLDYEFSKGKMSEKLTPAKRYSYLVGKDEPCHTAQVRLYPIFAIDGCNPGLDELEEAFSVEAVTNEFFDQYRDKYLDLKEYLESNPDFVAESEARGFDSEQFAKKLMGQIVFLYFIQKKGWLGVNAFPARLTEREYKNGFYHSGQKPKQLMPYVYNLANDGMYYRNNDALFSLSAEDETALSKLVKGDKWGSGPKNFMRQIFEGCDNAGKNYFDDYLEPLFYTGLNRNRGANAFFPPLHRRIPFLNGGLFEELDGYDWENNDFSIPNELFSNKYKKGRNADGILDVFDRYNFTMSEDEPMEREVAIDPEMLGKVFENLLDVKDRKSKGAFYTPREIVHYMCQESIINYLSTKTEIPEDDIRKLVLYGEYFRDEDAKETLPVDNKTGKVRDNDKIYVSGYHMEFDKSKELEIPETIFSFKDEVNRIHEIDKLLADIKVVDPAVGSGAFPLGMLNEIVKVRETLTTYMAIGLNGYQRLNLKSMRNAYILKRDTIKNCIFACDIEASATDITKLRLWLSLVIDNQIAEEDNDELGYSTCPRELPNLDCNIICGNSLIDEFYGIPLITESLALYNLSKCETRSLFDEHVATMIDKLIELQSKLYDEKEHVAKNVLKEQIQYIYNDIIIEQLSINAKAVDAYYQALQQPSQPFILWQLYFPKVFRDNSGFDVVIGNPPYVSAPTQLDNRELAKQRETLNNGKRYKTLCSRWDLYIPFIELGIQLLRDCGTLAMIVPFPLTNQIYGKRLRLLATTEWHLKEIVDLHDVKVFDTATVQNCIPFIIKEQHTGSTYIADMRNGTIERCFTQRVENLVQDEKTQVWNLTNEVRNRYDHSSLHVLGDYCYVSYGLRPNSDEKKAKGEFVKKDLISDYIDSVPRRPYLEAKDIDKYEIHRVRYLEYGTARSPSKLVRPTFPELYEHPKILFNRLGELKGTMDEEVMYLHNDSIITCILWRDLKGVENRSITSSIKKYSTMTRPDMEKLSEEVDLKYLLGVMNSSIVRDLLLDKRGGDYHIYPEHVRNIPIARATKDEQAQVAEIVDELLDNGQNHTLMQRLDDYVEQLYLKDRNA